MVNLLFIFRRSFENGENTHFTVVILQRITIAPAIRVDEFLREINV